MIHDKKNKNKNKTTYRKTIHNTFYELTTMAMIP